jgi:tetratricopeptide (TPR) repeat protein
MMLTLATLLAVQAAPAPVAPPAPVLVEQRAPTRFDACLATAEADPQAGLDFANTWLTEGRSSEARQCLGMAHYYAGDFGTATTILVETAEAADAASHARRGDIWALAGLAATSADEAAAARGYFTRAIDSGTLSNFALGATLGRRAMVAVVQGDVPAARADLDRALLASPDNGGIWMLSATLARRMRDFARAQNDIQQAAALSPRDPQIALEAGNIAYMVDNLPAARRSWESVLAISNSGPVANMARRRLADLAEEEGSAAAAATPSPSPPPPPQ